MAKSKNNKPSTPKPKETPSGLRIKLQIAGAVFVPMAALGLWLNSKGFFS